MPGVEFGRERFAAGVMAFDCAMRSGMGPPGRDRVVGTESAGGVPGDPAWDMALALDSPANEAGRDRTIGSSGTEVGSSGPGLPRSAGPAAVVAVAVAAIVGAGDATDCVGIA